MKQFKLIALSILIALSSYAQDVVYSTDIDNNRIRKVQSDPITGNTSGSFSTVKNIIASAALGADSNGWLYYLNYGEGGEGDGKGKVDIYATRADGTGTPVKIVNSYDFNGNSSNDLGFVRLGIDATNIGWIVASDASTNKIYLAKFPANGGVATTATLVTSKLVTSDGDNSLFKNGDLAFDGNSNMYVMANNGSTTKIYTLVPTMVAQNAVATLQYKWTLKEKVGNTIKNFDGRVSGVAFTSVGSLYVSTDNGLYFVDQNTTNFVGIGTVQCSLIKQQDGLSDLATAYWPAHTKLPIRFRDFAINKLSKDIIEVVFSVEEALNMDRFNIKASRDGKTFTTITIILPDNAKPENTYRIKIDLTKVKF